MCLCSHDTSGWLSYGKRKWLCLEAGAKPRRTLQGCCEEPGSRHWGATAGSEQGESGVVYVH